MVDQRFSGISYARILTVALVLGGLTGCDVLSTDVENPNVVVQEDVEKPAAASSRARAASSGTVSWRLISTTADDTCGGGTNT